MFTITGRHVEERTHCSHSVVNSGQSLAESFPLSLNLFFSSNAAHSCTSSAQPLPNESAEYPPHCPSLNNVADNVCPSGWVNPDPNDELSDEEWEALVAEENAADDATLDA